MRPTYAGFWLRAVAYLIDTLLVSAVFGLLASFYPSAFLKFPDVKAISLASLPQLTPLALVLTFLVVWLYYAFFEASVWQATPGKRTLQTLYVTDLNGRPLTFARASMRYFAKMISGLTFLVGYFLAGFTDKKQALHDILSPLDVLYCDGSRRGRAARPVQSSALDFLGAFRGIQKCEGIQRNHPAPVAASAVAAAPISRGTSNCGKA